MTDTLSSAATNPIDDDVIAHMKSFVDTPLIVGQFNDQASHDVIKHYAWGIGDLNPLWLDDSYASKTRFGGRVGPPTILYSFCDGGAARGLPAGVRPLQASSRLVLRRPIRLGEWVRAELTLADVSDMKTRKYGRIARQQAVTRFYSGDEELGRVEQTMLCVPENGNQSPPNRSMQTYSEAELDDIEASIRAEVRRGPEPRYLEDVNVGDDVPAVVKGPLDQMAMTSYYAGAIGNAGYWGVESRVAFHDRVRAQAADAPTTFDAHHWLARTHISLGHQDPIEARKIGMVAPYDNGNQRTAWVAHCATNWMGDDADLLDLKVTLAGPNVWGDTLYISGTVDGVSPDASEVTLGLVGRNQLDEVSTNATARIRLPRR